MSLDNTKKINRVVVNGEDVQVVGVPTLQEKSVTPTTSSQRVIADTGYDGLSGVNVEAVTSSVDANIIPTNIRRGTTILGVQGNLDADKPDQSKTVTPTTSQQNIVADTGYELAQVTVNAVTSDIDANIQEGNIKEGVTILGKTGTFKGGIQPSGTIEITENNKTYDVTNYASANVNVPAIGTGLNELILMGKWLGSSDDPNSALVGETCFYFESNKHFTATIDNATIMSGEYTIDGQNVYLMDGAVVFGYDAETGLLIQEGESIVFTKVDVRAGQPIKVSKEDAMADLAEEFNVGNVFEFVGTSDTYETGALYIVSEV